jgi:hypothetical protein
VNFYILKRSLLFHFASSYNSSINMLRRDVFELEKSDDIRKSEKNDAVKLKFSDIEIAVSSREILINANLSFTFEKENLEIISVSHDSSYE